MARESVVLWGRGKKKQITQAVLPLVWPTGSFRFSISSFFLFFFYSFSLSRKRRRPDGNHHPSSFFFVNWPVVRPLHAYRMMSLTLLYRNRKKWIFSFVAEASKVYYLYSPIRSGFALRQGPFFCCCCCCISISFLNR